MPSDKIETIMNVVKTWTIAWIWWMAHYLYEVSQWAEFKIVKFLINIFLAGFVWYLVWELLSTDFVLRDSFIAMSWFSAFPILSIVENNFPKIIEKLIIKK